MNDQIRELLDKHGLTIESEFVPFSKSRNAGKKYPSLNWKVTLKQNGRTVLKTDYMAGCGHAPSYKQGKQTYDDKQVLAAECETGYKCRYVNAMGVTSSIKSQPILPDIQSVIYSLLMDSDVLNYARFEEWAAEFGYDSDSRKDEQIYNACLKIALQLRTIGESTLAELREAYQDY